MRTRIVWLVLCFLGWSGLAAPAAALANRVFVSARSGNDANACDNILTPCQTFAGAVPKLNAGGEAIVLDSGGYGPVTITQSVTIEAPPGVTAFIHPPSGNAITVSAGGGDKVVLRGLVLNGGFANGILVNSVGALQIENCVVSGFTSEGLLVLSDAAVFLKDSLFRQNFDGAAFSGGRASVDHCRFESNSNLGMEVVASDVSVRDSLAAGNGSHGFFIDASGSQNTVFNLYASSSTNNGGDGVSTSNTGTGFAIARVANSSVSENFGQGMVAGASVSFQSLGNNFVQGNVAGNTAGTIQIVGGQ